MEFRKYRKLLRIEMDLKIDHKMFHQLNKINTNNIIMAMFRVLKIMDQDGNILWKLQSENSGFAKQPLLIQMGKESVEKLLSLALYNQNIEDLQNIGVNVDLEDKSESEGSHSLKHPRQKSF